MTLQWSQIYNNFINLRTAITLLSLFFCCVCTMPMIITRDVIAARHGISLKLAAVLGARNSAAKVQKGGDAPPRPGRPVGIGQPRSSHPVGVRPSFRRSAVACEPVLQFRVRLQTVFRFFRLAFVVPAVTTRYPRRARTSCSCDGPALGSCTPAPNRLPPQTLAGDPPTGYGAGMPT